MASDARVRYTKMVIVQSFVKLLKEKSINKITVKEICAMSEINRATFYKHYLDVYDLLDKIEEQFLKELNGVLNSRENNTLKDTLTFIMVSFKAEKEMYSAITSQNGDPAFPKKIFDACYHFVRPQATVPKHLTEAQKEWMYCFTAYGCNGILTKWISNGMKEPISEVADFAEQMIVNVIK